jgi:hypothetical protein
MPKLVNYLGNIDFHDEKFIGTIAFRSEEFVLPDDSKMALGIDDGHWVLVYQARAGAPFQVFEYDQRGRKILLDKKNGGEKELTLFKERLGYFFAHVQVDDLVTILPPQA